LSVVGRVRPDDRTAFEALYRAHANAVLAYALRRTSAATAEDIVAETFAVAWRRLDRLPSEPLAWLLGTARKVLANERRGAQRRGRLLERLRGEPAPLSNQLDAEIPDALAALQRLPPAAAEVLKLIAWEELTPTQAAQMLSCSPVAFRLRLMRARRRLRAELGDLQREAAPSRDEPLPDHTALGPNGALR
jgi:RNA polymerase sigma-70 factor (ECF subfamily)